MVKVYRGSAHHELCVLCVETLYTLIKVCRNSVLLDQGVSTFSTLTKVCREQRLCTPWSRLTYGLCAVEG